MSKAFQRIQELQSISKSKNWLSIKTIDMHTGGEPLRVILSGIPEIKGKSILEKRHYTKENFDHIRRLLMLEPRGHADMYGCILLPPVQEDSDFGVLFLHNEGYSTMCGHAVIALTKLAVQLNWVDVKEPKTEIRIDAPCGLIKCAAIVSQGLVEKVYFDGVPSFVKGLNVPLQTKTLGKIEYDLAYGGAFYAYVDADKYDIALSATNYRNLIDLGMEIKQEVINSSSDIEHPLEHDLSFLYGTIFTSTKSDKADSKNVCIFANGEVDRSPTGSGVSGRMAIHWKRGEIDIDQTMTIESIVGSVFAVSVTKVVQYGSQEAVIPRVEGTAFITGEHTFLLDPADNFKQGFFLR